MTHPLPATLALHGKHRLALEQALAWLPEVASPVGWVVTGSIVRGNPGPSSDLDLVVLHDQPWRRRVQRWFNETPVELFFNSEAWLRHSIADASEGRPVMAHMLATGVLLHDTGGRMADLQAMSRELLLRGPEPSAGSLLRDRYAAANQVDDALDFGLNDSPDARRVRALAVEALLKHEFLRRNQFLPRPKERIGVLAETAPDLAGLLARALCEASAEAATSALREAAEQVLGASGFFEWDSGPDSTAPRSPS